LQHFGMGLGGVALAEMLSPNAAIAAGDHGLLGAPHFRAESEAGDLPLHVGRAVASRFVRLQAAAEGTARRAIAGQRPRGTQRLTAMSGNQASIPLVGSPFQFTQHGDGGAWFSETLPHTASIADKLCVVNSMFTEAINHGPGVTFLQTGTQIAGRAEFRGMAELRPRAGEFQSAVVRGPHHQGQRGQPLGAHLWGSGFIPSKHQGVLFRAAEDPVALSAKPRGDERIRRRLLLDRLREIARASIRRYARH